MYRRIGALLTIILILGGVSASNVSAGAWNQPSSSLILKNEGAVSATAVGSWCPIGQTFDTIEYLGDRFVCNWNGSHSFVTFYDNGRVHAAAKMSPEGKLYPVKGVCEAVLACVYSPGSDSAVEKNFGDNWSKNLVVSKRVGESLRWKFDSNSMSLAMQYSATDSRRTVVDGDGVPVFAEAIAISKDGNWLAAELYDNGLARINLSTLVVQRIMDQRYRYGQGMDPHLEIAIAHDGSAVMIGGLNGGFALVNVTDSCGDVWKASHPGTYTSGVSWCPYGDVGVNALVLGTSLFYRPQFFINKAVVIARNSIGDRAVSISRTQDPTSISYLALGDSYASGEGETDDANYLSKTNIAKEKCHVSSRSYPFLMNINGGKNIACSGAQMIDILGSDTYTGQNDRFALSAERALLNAEAEEEYIPGRLPQINFVETKNPKIITIGVGGNDAGLMEKLRSCVTPGTCEWAKPDKLQRTAREIQALYPKLQSLYRTLRETAPTARLFVIGYPDILSRTDSCNGLTGLLFSQTERMYLLQTISYLNQVMQTAAVASGIPFVSLEGVYGESGLCGNDQKKAISGLRLGDDIPISSILPGVKVIGNESFHPTPYGHMLTAAEILDRTTNLTTSSCGVLCGVPHVLPTPNSFWNMSGDSARAAKSKMTQTIVPLFTKMIRISLPRSSFVPGSSVNASIHSDPIHIGTATVGKSGQVEASFQLSSSLTMGYHNVHIEGKAQDGAILDLYQGIEVVDEPPITAEVEPAAFSTTMKQPSVFKAHIDPDGVTTEVPISVIDTSSYLITIPANSSRVPVVSKAIDDTRMKYGDDWLRIMAAVLTLMGIIVVCFTLVHLLRK
jgi:lysophospholipase L1-like esterase